MDDPTAEFLEHWQQLLPASFDTFFEGLVDEVFSSLGVLLQDGSLVWSTEDTPMDHVIYGTPHIDRRHQVKAFIYLTDVGMSMDR